MAQEKPIVVQEPKELEVDNGTDLGGTVSSGEYLSLNPIILNAAKSLNVPDISKEQIETISGQIWKVYEDEIIVTPSGELKVPTYFEKDIEEIVIKAIQRGIADGKLPSGGGEVVEGGFTIKFLDKDDKNLYVFSSLSGGSIRGLSPYPTKEGYLFKGYTTIKNDLSTMVSFPITVSEDKTYYPFFRKSKYCDIENLGTEYPADVVFTKSTNFPTENQAWEEVVINENYFAKFTKWYKKVEVDENGNVRKIHLSQTKDGPDFHLYDCFIDEDGNELDYILIGRYNISSTTEANSVNATRANLNLSTARTLARAKGQGYQLFDASMFNFWRDLALAVFGNVNFNSGVNRNNYLGLTNFSAGGEWIDGIALNDGTYLYSNKPSKYVNEPTASTDGYSALSYGITFENTDNYEVKELGYDTNYPSINFPKEKTTNSNYDTYYCDLFSVGGGVKPFYAYIGYNDKLAGLFAAIFSISWTNGYGTRLAYRPIGGNQ